MRGVDLTNFEKRLKPYFYGGRRSMTADQAAVALGINLVRQHNGIPHAPKCVTERLNLLVSLGRLTYSKVYAAYQLVKGVDLAAPLPRPETPSDAEIAAREALKDEIRYLLQTQAVISDHRLAKKLGTLALVVAEEMPEVAIEKLGSDVFLRYAAADREVAA